jgi:hypothetical protein
MMEYVGGVRVEFALSSGEILQKIFNSRRSNLHWANNYLPRIIFRKSISQHLR